MFLTSMTGGCGVNLFPTLSNDPGYFQVFEIFSLTLIFLRTAILASLLTYAVLQERFSWHPHTRGVEGFDDFFSSLCPNDTTPHIHS